MNVMNVTNVTSVTNVTNVTRDGRNNRSPIMTANRLDRTCLQQASADDADFGKLNLTDDGVFVGF